MSKRSIAQTILSRVAENPSGVFLIDLNRSRQFTNQEMQYIVARILQVIGSEPQIIAAYMHGGASDAFLILAALVGGHQLLPFAPDMVPQEVRRLCLSRKVQTIIGAPNGSEAELKLGSATRFMSAHDLEVCLGSLIAGVNNELANYPGEGGIMLSTSGSTGMPKQLFLPEELLIKSATQIAQVHELSPLDRGMTELPLHHVNAIVVSLLTCLTSGGQVQMARRHSSSHFWQWVETYKPTWISVVPAIVTMLLNLPTPPEQTRHGIRFFRSASAPLPAKTLEAFEQKLQLPMIETYGISEGAATIASNPLPPAPHFAGSVGQAVPNLTIRICAPDGLKPLEPGEIGEVCVKGESIIDHYEDHIGADSFVDGWFRTGDLGYFDDQSYLYLVARSKDVIIRGGENIFPAEIEAALLQYPGIIEAAVIGRPDDLYGERVVAYVASAAPSLDTKQLYAFLADQLSASKLPSDIQVLPALPKTSANKINKPALRQLT